MIGRKEEKNICFHFSLRNNAEVAIVVSKEYQNRHIGRRCINEMVTLAAEKGMTAITANIYSFNTQSQRMFLAVGFHKTGEEWYQFSEKLCRNMEIYMIISLRKTQ